MELFLFMTLSASLLILIALFLRPLTGRIFPRITQMLLWVSAALRLLIPVRISSPIGLFGRTYMQPQTVPAPVYPEVPAEPIVLPDVPDISNVPVSPEIVISEAVADVPTVAAEDILLWVWLSGVVLMFSAVLFFHIRNLIGCKNKMRDRNAESIVPCTCAVYRCAAVQSPFVYGILRPRIVLPVRLSGGDLSAVLSHEAAHIRRLDLVKKYLFAAALCIHWFNPLVWLMVFFSAQDMEILCDAHALSMPGAPNVKTYAHALINAEERRTVFNLGFKSNTEVRIMKILKKDKHNKLLMFISVLLAVLLVTACTTSVNPTSEPSEVKTTPSENKAESTALSSEEPTDSPTVSTDIEIVQPTLKEEPTESVQNLFEKDGMHGFGGLQVGMSWEEAKPIIAELTGNKALALPETYNYYTRVAFPYSVFGYDGTVTVTFTTNSYQITEIVCTIPLEGNEAIEAAYNTAFEEFCDQFGSPTESYDTTNDHHWYLPDCRLGLYISPIGTNYTEKESVKICIYPLSFEGQPESVPIGETIDNSEAISEENTSSEVYYEEYERFPVHSEGEAYTALEFIDDEIYQLNQHKNQIAKLLDTWESDKE